MMIFNLNKTFFLALLLLLSFMFTASCGGFKRSDVKDNPINDADKRAKNIQEGRGIGALLGGKKNSGVFDFATSNEMWRATIDILDFTPLSNVDYGGGIIITDWYSDSKESIKISVQFLSNDIRADGLNVKIYKKNCGPSISCPTQKVEGTLNTEIKLAILKKAALIKKSDRKKSGKKKGEYKVVPTQ